MDRFVKEEDYTIREKKKVKINIFMIQQVKKDMKQ